MFNMDELNIEEPIIELIEIVKEYGYIWQPGSGPDSLGSLGDNEPKILVIRA